MRRTGRFLQNVHRGSLFLGVTRGVIRRMFDCVSREWLPTCGGGVGTAGGAAAVRRNCGHVCVVCEVVTDADVMMLLIERAGGCRARAGGRLVACGDAQGEVGVARAQALRGRGWGPEPAPDRRRAEGAHHLPARGGCCVRSGGQFIGPGSWRAGSPRLPEFARLARAGNPIRRAENFIAPGKPACLVFSEGEGGAR